MAGVILSVGQCGFDHARIARRLAEVGVQVDRAFDAQEARLKMSAQAYDLVLVNRVFDADGDSGVDFIKTCKIDGGVLTPMMLVSDYADAQAAAVEAGARPGFGKSELSREETLQRILEAVG